MPGSRFDISTVIPVHNRADLLPRSIESVRTQSCPVREILVVDDHSSEDIRAVCARYQGEPEVRYLPNSRERGAQGARNTGILAARYEWVAFQDSDDAWAGDKIEEQSAVLARSGEHDLVVHTGAVFRKDTTGEEEYVGFGRDYVGQCTTRLLKHHGPLFPTILVRKRTLEAIGLLDEQVPSYQEWDTSIRLSKVAPFAFVDKPLFTYYIDAPRSISGHRRREIDGKWYISRKFIDDMQRTFSRRKCRRILLTRGRQAARSGCNDVVAGYLDLMRAHCCGGGTMIFLRTYFGLVRMRDALFRHGKV